jgi:hypothetical protein
VSEQTLDNDTFIEFVASLKPLINEMKKEYSVEPVYKADPSEESAYWKDVKKCIDDGENWLLGKMNHSSKNLDRHKYSALLLVVLIKRPLFESDNLNKTIGNCSAGINFAWKAALHLLTSFIKTNGTKPAEYIKYIEQNGISLPSEEYSPETLRTFQTLFRPFKEEGKSKADTTFSSMLDNRLLCTSEVWGFALLFANNFSLLESSSFACFERKLLYDKFKARPSAASSH